MAIGRTDLREWREAARLVAGVVLPVRCALCDAEDWGVCPPCVAALTPRVRTRLLALSQSGAVLPVYSAAAYSGTCSDALVAFKAAGALALARPLGAMLAASLQAAVTDELGATIMEGGSPPLRLITAPSSRRAMRERGYVPIRRVLQHALKSLPDEVRQAFVVAPGRALGLVRQTSDQTDLDRDQRQLNLHGALRLHSAEPPARVIFVDDIVTTGATVTEAARAVEEAGSLLICAVTIASTERRGHKQFSRSATG